jgi:hypothetical protein
MMKASLLAILTTALLAGPTAANAVPIPVASGVGNGLIVNFDFTGSSPSAPYSSILTTFQLSGIEVGEAVRVDVFQGLNATGLTVVSNTFLILNNFLYSFGQNGGPPGYLDGVYSFVFRVNPGTGAELLSPSATGRNAGGQATIAGVAVPEPGSLALFGAALAALAFVRRKRAA